MADRGARRLRSAGLVLGIGLGGFVDGILLHQILQWHNMLSARIPPLRLVDLKVNMLWDGLFHAFTWTAVMVGLLLLWRAWASSPERPPTATFAGALLAGWGLFNVVEGAIDHHLLGLHHVRPGEGQLAWDLGFLGLGALQVGLGWALMRRGRHRRRAAARGPLEPVPLSP